MSVQVREPDAVHDVNGYIHMLRSDDMIIMF